MTLAASATLLAWLLVAVGFWLAYFLSRQNERTIIRLTRLERHAGGLYGQLEDLMPEDDSGLAAGTEAPAFELPDLDGRPVLLEDLRGSRVLLTFMSPTCPHSQEMAPEFARLKWEGEVGRPVPVMVAIGELDAIRAMVAEHGIRGPVLFDEKVDILSVYEAGGTPAAYLIDEWGVISRPRADGGPDILQLAELAPSLHTAPRPEAPAPERKRGGGAAVKPAATETGATREIRLPFGDIPEDGIGVGDLVKRMTDLLHIKPCRGCEGRQKALNRWVIKGSGGKRGVSR